MLLVDDGSSDATVAEATKALAAAQVPPERFALLSAGPRPSNERWVGKNWPCTHRPSSTQVRSTWVLFIDADVRLQPQTLVRALGLAEWMVQPIMASLLGLRLWTRRQFQVPIDHWWLMGAVFMR